MALPMLWRLISNRLRMGVNAFQRGSAAKRWRSRGTALLVMLIFCIVYSAARNGFDAIGLALVRPYGSRSAAEMVLGTIPPGFFFACFGMLLTSAVTVGLQVLYLSQEMSLLMACPIPSRMIFAAKFVDALGANSALFLALGLPVLLAYGASQAVLSIGYLLLILCAMVGFAAIATSLGLLLCILVARVVSPAHATRTLAALGLTMLGLLFAASVGLMAGVQGVVEHGHDLDSMLQGQWSAYKSILSYPPWSWAGGAITRLVMFDDLRGALKMLGLLLGMGALASVVVSSVAGRLWYAGWVSGQGGAARARRRKASSSGSWGEGLLILMPPTVRGMVIKEWRTYMRDIRQLSLLVMPMIAIILLIMGMRFGGMRAISELSTGLPLVMLFVLISSLSYRIALATFTSENRAFWVIHSSTARMRTVLTGKVIFSALVSYAISVFGLTLSYLVSGVPLAMVGTAAVLLAIGVIALCGLGVGLSALFVDFNQESARESVSLGGRLFCLVVDLIYLGAAVAVGALVYSATKTLGFSHMGMWMATVFSVGLVSALFAIIPVQVGAGRLSRLEWS